MAWTIEYSDTAKKQLGKLDRQIARRIVDYMDRRVANAGNPRNEGKPLKGPLGGLWRYRVGDYRVVCEIEKSGGKSLWLASPIAATSIAKPSPPVPHPPRPA